VIKEISEIINLNPYKQVCIFNNYCERFDNYNVPILPLNQAKFFNGDLFLLDTVSLMLTKDFPNVERKFFYTNSPVWQEAYNTYELWLSLLDQKNLHHIVTDQKLSDIFEICWNKQTTIMKNFSAKEIIYALQ
jgi:hypothetical protein